MTLAAIAMAARKFDVAIEAGGDASPVLDAAEPALDEVALLDESERSVLTAAETTSKPITTLEEAQADLLRFFKEKRAPHHQIVYSIHSPFMVPADELASVRIVEDKVETKGQRRMPLGTKVREDVLTRDPDTLFPLQGALAARSARRCSSRARCSSKDRGTPSTFKVLDAKSAAVTATLDRAQVFSTPTTTC